MLIGLEVYGLLLTHDLYLRQILDFFLVHNVKHYYIFAAS